MNPIERLPEYPVIQELSRALWRVGDLRGAAVMVGAGFSRNAELPGPTSQPSPVWSHLMAAMQKALGERLGGTGDPLQIAQRYEAIFGRQALDGLLRSQVPDLGLQPGALHRRLLRLPWSEILTTNYDTLLERCAERSPGQTYEVVRTQNDIPRTRSPRIVKLHGTLPSGPFIVSREDYRHYPRAHAAMVNLVQQVLLENHLVLIGFSASDPNFQAWTGWVRDNLGDIARRLILVGLFDLPAGERRVLENRGIAIVDLSTIILPKETSNSHGVALDYFLTALEDTKPSSAGSWDFQEPPETVHAPIPDQPHNGIEAPQHWFDAEAARRRLEARIPGWISDRENYPGWIVAPSHMRRALRTSISFDSPRISESIQALEQGARTRAVYEFAWRHDTAMAGMPAWLLSEISTVLDNNCVSLTSFELIQLALFSLTAAREARKEARFDAIQEWIGRQSFQDPDLIATASYEKAIWARDGLEFIRLGDLVDQIGGRDPIFKLRRAALWCELGAYEKAYDLVTQALAELRDRRSRDRNSIWILSRYGWALYIARQIQWSRAAQGLKRDHALEEADELWPSHDLTDNSCDPVQEIYNLDEELSRSERRAAEVRIARRPGFDAGAFTVHRYDLGDREDVTSVVGGDAVRIALRVGIPTKFKYTDINRSRINRTLAISTLIFDEKILPLCALVDKDSGGAIDRFLNRISVANLSPKLAQEALDRAMSAIDALLPYLSKETAGATGWSDDHARHRVSLLLEIASRLVIRAQPTEASAVLSRGLSWAQDPRWQHSWTNKSFKNLLSRSIEIIPQSDRDTLIFDAIKFPLPGEKDPHHATEYWPEPIEDFQSSAVTNRQSSPHISARIESLLEYARTSSKIDRERALLRLSKLYDCGILQLNEINAFAEALWGRLGSNGLPEDTSFRKFAFLELPQIPPGRAETALRETFFPPQGDISVSEEFLDLLLVERRHKDGGGAFIKLETSDVLRSLDAILKFCEDRRTTRSKDIFNDRDRILDYIGPALAVGILPILDRDSIGLDRLARVLAFIESGSVPSAIQAWPQIVRIDSRNEQHAVNSIVESLLSADNERVNLALWAVERWRVMALAGTLETLPQLFISTLMGIISTRRFVGLSGSLRILTSYLKNFDVTEEQTILILISLKELIDETASAEAVLEDESAALRAGTLTLVRREAARLALLMKNKGVTSQTLDHWMRIIAEDPFPEVRSLATEDT